MSTDRGFRIIGSGMVELKHCGGLKECLVKESEEVCGITKDLQRHRETWWWNEEVSQVIKEKK